jgi:hypothetical protein
VNCSSNSACFLLGCLVGNASECYHCSGNATCGEIDVETWISGWFPAKDGMGDQNGFLITYTTANLYTLSTLLLSMVPLPDPWLILKRW